MTAKRVNIFGHRLGVIFGLGVFLTGCSIAALDGFPSDGVNLIKVSFIAAGVVYGVIRGFAWAVSGLFSDVQT